MAEVRTTRPGDVPAIGRFGEVHYAPPIGAGVANGLVVVAEEADERAGESGS